MTEPHKRAPSQASDHAHEDTQDWQIDPAESAHRDWRTGLIPSQIFSNWLNGEYLLGMRQSVEHEVLLWSLMLRGIYSYSVYEPGPKWNPKTDSQLRTAKKLFSLTKKKKFRLLHIGYCIVDLHEGQLVLRGVRTYTHGARQCHSPLYWRSTQSKVETGSPSHQAGEDSPKCSFIYRLSDADAKDHRYSDERDDIASAAFPAYKGKPPVDPDKQRLSAHIDPWTLREDDFSDLLTYLRKPRFIEDVTAVSAATPNPLRGLVVIDLKEPPNRGDRAWNLLGQYQQLVHKGRWGQICFTRVGGLPEEPAT
jgi:hypothetical protein